MSRPYYQDLPPLEGTRGGTAPFVRDFFIVEPKADGCFGLLTPDGRIASRNDTTLATIPIETSQDFVLVGEYMARTPWSTEEGRSGIFYAFDILVDEGLDVSDLPLLERKKRLASVVFDLRNWRVEALPWSRVSDIHPASYWNRWVLRKGWEGLVFKSRGAYGEGWGRMKRVHECDFILVDFDDPKVEDHVGRLVGSAVIGHRVDGDLVVVGRISAGFDHEMRREMFLDPSAFIGRVMKVRGHGVFKSGAMRHPVFNGWHADKRAEECSA